MSPSISGQTQNPLSELTVAGLEDIGWIVDFSNAQPYVPNPSNSCRVTCDEPRRKLRGQQQTPQRDGTSRGLFLNEFFEDVADNLEDIGDAVDDILEEVVDRILPLLTDEQIRMAARSAFEGMKKARELMPDMTQYPGLEFAMADAMTVFIYDDDQNVRDLTFKWDDVKDMFDPLLVVV